MSRRRPPLRPAVVAVFGLLLALGLDPIRLDIASTAFANGEDEEITGLVRGDRGTLRGHEVTEPGDDDQPTIRGRKREHTLTTPEPVSPGTAIVKRGKASPTDPGTWTVYQRLHWLFRHGMGGLR